MFYYQTKNKNVKLGKEKETIYNLIVEQVWLNLIAG